uniref:Uncharacterized protein n=1 Tax=Leptobrachium leishanense TaxID=445787 RepID=A0A8C5QX44_9ANUR
TLFSKHVPFILCDQLALGDGRGLFLKGTIAGSVYTFANVYLPNSRQHICFRKIARLLHSFAEGVLVLRATFRSPPSPSEDSSRRNTSTPHHILRDIRRGLLDLQLVDAWRTAHPTTRDFTHFSAVHATYTRIDYIFVSHFALASVRSAAIHSRTWSDHAPISLSFVSPHCRPRTFQWRLNTTLLADPLVQAELTERLSTYFADNDTGEVSPTTVWEAHKATMRGHIIGIATAKKRERRRETEELMSDIRTLELTHMQSHDLSIYGQLLQKRARLAELSNLQIHHAILKTKCFFAYNENRPGRLLARMLRKRRTQNYIPQVRRSTGLMATLPDDIILEFRDFY